MLTQAGARHVAHQETTSTTGLGLANNTRCVHDTERGGHGTALISIDVCVCDETFQKAAH